MVINPKRALPLVNGRPGFKVHQAIENTLSAWIIAEDVSLFWKPSLISQAILV
ncbi:MAG: hypothetical protein U1E76_06770 [Planctomycetota bacterium]